VLFILQSYNEQLYFIGICHYLFHYHTGRGDKEHGTYGIRMLPTKTTRQEMHVKSHNEKRSRNHCCRGKAISITYFEPAFIDLVTQYAKRMRLIILSSLACLTVPFFPHYITRWTIFRKKSLLKTKCLPWFSKQLLSETFLLLNSNSARYYHLHVK
jgi:hypothetical protein